MLIHLKIQIEWVTIQKNVFTKLTQEEMENLNKPTVFNEMESIM